MRNLHYLGLFILATLVELQQANSQVFPDAASLSTGQGNIGELDSVWSASPWFDSPPGSPNGLVFTPALINNSCAPGAWVDPTQLPPPVNNANWITGNEGPCDNNSISGFRFFRLTLILPEECAGQSILTPGTYVLYLSGYADNTITDVFVNSTSTGISGGDFTSSGFLAMELTGPWVVGTNYVDVLIENFPGGENNPYGLLLVADSNAGSTSDLDGDGFSDFVDECPCQPGVENGCNPETISNTICFGESLLLSSPIVGAYLWSNSSTESSILVSPTEATTYTLNVTDNNGLTWDFTYEVEVFPLIQSSTSITLCADSTIVINGQLINETGVYTLAYTSWTGCDSLVTLEVAVIPTFESLQQWELCAGDTFYLGGQAFMQNGVYEVLLSSSAGCDSLIRLNLSLNDCSGPCYLRYPNIITANDDGLNDSFDLSEQGCTPKDFKLTIFNRWGSQIFESDSTRRQWRGECNSDECPSGVYYYRVTFTDDDGNPISRHGYVQLIR